MNKICTFFIICLCLCRCASVSQQAQTAALLQDQKNIIESRTATFGTQPSGISSDLILQDPPVIPNALLNVTVPAIENESYIRSFQPVKTDDKDSTKTEPVLEPMVLAGTGVTVLGVGAAVAAVFATPVLFFLAAALFGVGCWLCAIGWKRIKKDPKKYKGEKFAMASYIIVGIIGVASSFYLLYLLFTI